MGIETKTQDTRSQEERDAAVKAGMQYMGSFYVERITDRIYHWDPAAGFYPAKEKYTRVLMRELTSSLDYALREAV